MNRGIWHAILIKKEVTFLNDYISIESVPGKSYCKLQDDSHMYFIPSELLYFTSIRLSDLQDFNCFSASQSVSYLLLVRVIVMHTHNGYLSNKVIFWIRKANN